MLAHLGSLLQVIEIILGIGFLIFIHEGGHFLMAKWNGVRVEAFSMGFGPVLWSFRKGDTEYRLSVIPLGGYVKMAGENIGDEKTGAADELGAKSGWQRLQIFVAGAGMNALIAFPIVAAAFAIGLYEPGVEVGQVGRAETAAGLQPGDRIVSVGGAPVRSIDVYRREVIRARRGDSLPVVVDRGGVEKTLTVIASGSRGHDTLPPLNVVSEVLPGSRAEAAGLRAGDEILQADGKPVYGPMDLPEIILKSEGRPIPLKVRRPAPGHPLAHNSPGEEVELTVRPEVRPYVPEAMLDAVSIPRIGAVIEDKPAYGRLQIDDVVLKIDERPIVSWADMKQAIQDGAEHAFTVRRGSAEYVVRIKPEPDAGVYRIGVAHQPSEVIAAVPEGSAFAAAGFRPGDRIQAVDGDIGVNTTRKLAQTVVDSLPEKHALVVRIRRNESTENLTLSLDAFPRAGKDIGIGLDLQRIYLRFGPIEALRAAPKEVLDLFVLTFQLLKKLFTREEEAKGLAGPVGIFQISYRAAERGIGNLLWLLALITTNLAVVNVLPIPVLDGGHILFLAIEKIKGSPPSESFIAGAQWVGLILLLSLVLFVTYNDLDRWLNFARLFGG